MSIAIAVEIKSDTATPAIAALLERTQPERLVRIIGDPLRGFWRDHLKRLPRNARGWPSTGFWEEAADSVNAIPDGDTLILRADKQGLRQRFYGGVIEPRHARMLTIPISPVSYGHRASEFPGLFLLRTGKGAYLVQQGFEISAKTGNMVRKRKQGGNASRRRAASLQFLFKLSSGVVQAPNPDVVPSHDEFTEVAFAAITRSLGGITGGGSGERSFSA